MRGRSKVYRRPGDPSAYDGETEAASAAYLDRATLNRGTAEEETTVDAANLCQERCDETQRS
jgi:hypothetical protein